MERRWSPAPVGVVTRSSEVFASLFLDSETALMLDDEDDADDVQTVRRRYR